MFEVNAPSQWGWLIIDVALVKSLIDQINKTPFIVTPLEYDVSVENHPDRREYCYTNAKDYLEALEHWMDDTVMLLLELSDKYNEAMSSMR